MIIKKATRKDLQVLLKYMMDLQDHEHKLCNRVRADAKTRELFEKRFIKKRIANPDYIFLIAWEGDQPAGIATGWNENVSNAYKNEYVGYICQLIVDPKFRGKGVGKKLAERITEEFKSMGIKELKIEVLHNNQSSVKFWKKFGFEDMYRHMRKDI